MVVSKLEQDLLYLMSATRKTLFNIGFLQRVLLENYQGLAQLGI